MGRGGIAETRVTAERAMSCDAAQIETSIRLSVFQFAGEMFAQRWLPFAFER